MSNALYDKGREGFLDGSIDWDRDVIKAVLIDAADYTVNLATHQFLSDIPAAARVALLRCVGDTAVDTFSVPAIPSTNQWCPSPLTKTRPWGSSLRSIAIYVDTDFGAVDLYFDNIIACKAASAADSLTLQSLISKNSAAHGLDAATLSLKDLENMFSISLRGKLNKVKKCPRP
jgi:hypothetical protein